MKGEAWSPILHPMVMGAPSSDSVILFLIFGLSFAYCMDKFTYNGQHDLLCFFSSHGESKQDRHMLL